MNKHGLRVTVCISFFMGVPVPPTLLASDAKLHNRLLQLKDGGNDQRTIVDGAKAPWRAVGRLNRRIGGHCTATVIGPSLVLSAAHCLWNKRTRRYLPPRSLHFVAGWNKGDYLFHSRAAAIHPSPDYIKMRAKGIRAFTHDWALIELVDDPVGVTGMIAPATGKLAYQPKPVNRGPYTQAGYSADKRHVLSAHPECAFRGLDNSLNLIFHDCDALPGDSGSPIIMETKAGHELVAIHAGYVKTKSSSSGIAIPAASFMSAIDKLR